MSTFFIFALNKDFSSQAISHHILHSTHYTLQATATEHATARDLVFFKLFAIFGCESSLGQFILAIFEKVFLMKMAKKNSYFNKLRSLLWGSCLPFTAHNQQPTTKNHNLEDEGETS